MAYIIAVKKSRFSTLGYVHHENNEYIIGKGKKGACIWRTKKEATSFLVSHKTDYSNVHFLVKKIKYIL